MCNVNHVRNQDTHTHRGEDGVPIGILRTRWTDEGNTWRPWRQCILPEYLRIHLWPNGPSTKCSRSVTTVTYAYRVVGIMREQMSPKEKNIVRASVSNGHGESSEVSYKYINEEKNKVFFFLLNFFLFYVTHVWVFQFFRTPTQK